MDQGPAWAERAERIRTLARALVRDAHDAEDLGQQAWLASLSERPAAGSSWSAWIAAVMRNLVRIEWRGRTRREARERFVARDESQPSESELVAQLEVHELLARAVRELDEPYREVILRRYFDGRTPKQIAASTGESVRTIDTRLRRALERLRGRLDAQRPREEWLALALPFIRRSPAASTGALVVSTIWKAAAVSVAVVSIAWFVRDRVANTAGAENDLAARPLDSADMRDERDGAASAVRVDEVAPDTSQDAVAVSEPTPDAAPIAAAPESFAARLDRIAATFLGDKPDFEAFAALWDEFGASAQLVEESVLTQDTAFTMGELALPDCALRAKFRVEGSHYRIEFLTPYEGDGSFVLRSATLSFDAEEGLVSSAGGCVQFHPDTRKSASEHFREKEELVLGWTVSDSGGRALARPISAWLADDGGWMIGNRGVHPKIDAFHAPSLRAAQALADTIRPARPR